MLLPYRVYKLNKHNCVPVSIFWKNSGDCRHILRHPVDIHIHLRFFNPFFCVFELRLKNTQPAQNSSKLFYLVENNKNRGSKSRGKRGGKPIPRRSNMSPNQKIFVLAIGRFNVSTKKKYTATATVWHAECEQNKQVASKRRYSSF